MFLEVYDRKARLTVEKQVGHQGMLLVTYAPRRRLPTGPDIRFRLGREGDVDLRFVPDQVAEHEYSNCTGGPEIVERGHFVGTIRFRGREDFARAEAHRVDGLVTRTPPHRCRREKSRNGVNAITVGIGTGTPGVPKGALELIAGTADRKLQFTGYRSEERLPLPPTETFLASIEQVESGFTATSSAFGGISHGGFVSAEPREPLAAAEISPSAPFSGSADFALTAPRHAEWTGDLAVELPGYGRVPLTGPKIRAGLCETKACTPTLPKSLRPPTRSEADGLQGQLLQRRMSR